MPSGRLQSAVVRNAEGAPHVLKTGDAPRETELTTRLRGVVQPTAARVEPKEAGCVERRSSGFVEAPRSNRSVLAVGEYRTAIPWFYPMAANAARRNAGRQGRAPRRRAWCRIQRRGAKRRGVVLFEVGDRMKRRREKERACQRKSPTGVRTKARLGCEQIGWKSREVRSTVAGVGSSRAREGRGPGGDAPGDRVKKKRGGEELNHERPARACRSVLSETEPNREKGLARGYRGASRSCPEKSCASSNDTRGNCGDPGGRT